MRLAVAQGVEAQPLIQGEAAGLKVAVQGVEIEILSQHNKAVANSPGDLNRAMWEKGFAKLVLKPGEIKLTPMPGSQQPNITIAIPDIDPTPTFSVMPTGITGIDQNPAVLFLNTTTLDELARLVTATEPVSTVKQYLSTGDVEEDTLSVIDPAPTQETVILTRISTDPERERLESSAFISPTPVPTVRVEGESHEAKVRLEFEGNITLIQPSPSKGYGDSGSKIYTVSCQPRQVGTTSGQGAADSTSSTASETSQSQASPSSTSSASGQPPPTNKPETKVQADSTGGDDKPGSGTEVGIAQLVLTEAEQPRSKPKRTDPDEKAEPLLTTDEKRKILEEIHLIPFESWTLNFDGSRRDTDELIEQLFPDEYFIDPERFNAEITEAQKQDRIRMVQGDFIADLCLGDEKLLEVRYESDFNTINHIPPSAYLPYEYDVRVFSMGGPVTFVAVVPPDDQRLDDGRLYGAEHYEDQEKPYKERFIKELEQKKAETKKLIEARLRERAHKQEEK